MIKLTKTELRGQQYKLKQLEKYLPTLQLKKMLLQIEVNTAESEIERELAVFSEQEVRVKGFSKLFTERFSTELLSSVRVEKVLVTHENIAGVDVPVFGEVLFEEYSYPLFDTPLWLDSAIEQVQGVILLKEKISILRQKKEALAKELREVSIRVNLFEKILIPRAKQNIRKISVFLGDLQLSSVSQAKVSKKKIAAHKALPKPLVKRGVLP